MSDDGSHNEEQVEYVAYEGKGADAICKIQEDGHIDGNTIGQFTYTCDVPKDLNAENERKVQKGGMPSAIQSARRVGYTSITVHYPDGNTSSAAVLTGVVLQYRKADEGNKYGREFVCIGVPTRYIDTIAKSVKKASSVNLVTAPNVATKDGYYWINSVKLNKLEAVKMAYTDGEGKSITMDLRDVVTGMEKGITADMTVVMSGKQIVDLSKKIDVDGNFQFDISPRTIFIKGISDTNGPEFTPQRTKTKAEISNKFFADSALVDLVAKKLNFN